MQVKVLMRATALGLRPREVSLYEGIHEEHSLGADARHKERQLVAHLCFLIALRFHHRSFAELCANDAGFGICSACKNNPMF